MLLCEHRAPGRRPSPPGSVWEKGSFDRNCEHPDLPGFWLAAFKSDTFFNDILAAAAVALYPFEDLFGCVFLRTNEKIKGKFVGQQGEVASEEAQVAV